MSKSCYLSRRIDFVAYLILLISLIFFLSAQPLSMCKASSMIGIVEQFGFCDTLDAGLFHHSVESYWWMKNVLFGFSVSLYLSLLNLRLCEQQKLGCDSWSSLVLYGTGLRSVFVRVCHSIKITLYPLNHFPWGPWLLHSWPRYRQATSWRSWVMLKPNTNETTSL